MIAAMDTHMAEFAVAAMDTHMPEFAVVAMDKDIMVGPSRIYFRNTIALPVKDKHIAAALAVV